MSSAPKILITGATGAIGYELLKQLCKADDAPQVHVLVRNTRKNNKLLESLKDKIRIEYGDVTNFNDVSEAVRYKDIIIHLAALIPPRAEISEELTTRVNVGGTKNMVKAIEELNPEARLIFSSSIATYGDRLKDPNITVNDPLAEEQEDHYGKTKIAAEKIIRSSSIKWTIFRLSAIMGVGNHKVSGLMFEMPLDTPMEIATVSDTARALHHAINKFDQLEGKIFNLGGGKTCFISYRDFLSRAFDIFGLGPLNFPKHAFAFQNFHCGYYADGDKLEEILHFRTDSIDSYFEAMKRSVPWIQRIATRPFAWIVKRFLLMLSKPYKAYRKKDKERMNYYFGES